MSADSINKAQAKLAEIYRTALGVKTMVLMAQGKPMHPDHPHTAVETSPEKAQQQLVKAEAFVGLLLEQIDAFARSFDLPDGWWVVPGESDTAEKV